MGPAKPPSAEQIIRGDDGESLAEPEGAQTPPRLCRWSGVYGSHGVEGGLDGLIDVGDRRAHTDLVVLGVCVLLEDLGRAAALADVAPFRGEELAAADLVGGVLASLDHVYHALGLCVGGGGGDEELGEC